LLNWEGSVKRLLFKRCSSCRKFSFSSTDERVWICPYCGEDISQEAAEPAGTGEKEFYGDKDAEEEPGYLEKNEDNYSEEKEENID